MKTGPGSFVMRATDYEDFAVAIREKLWREITVIISDGPAALPGKFALKGSGITQPAMSRTLATEFP